METIFTLDGANRILPLVRSITTEAVARYREARAASDDREALRRRLGRELAPGALARQDAVVKGLLDDLRRLFREMEALGCRLKDLERGVVDFPAALLPERGFAVYCWTLGEARVSHWHGEDEGFEERRLLVAEAA